MERTQKEVVVWRKSMSVVERETSAEEMLGRVCSGQCMSLKDSLDPRFWYQSQVTLRVSTGGTCGSSE